MNDTSFLTPAEVAAIGFAAAGREVLVSRHARFYRPGRIRLGDRVRIDDFCLLSAGGDIVIGHHVHLSAYVAVYGGGGVRIGDYASLSPRVTLLSQSDDFGGESMVNPLVPAACRPGLRVERITLGRHAAVGCGSTVLPGVTMGEGAVAGAHSLVTGDIEAWTLHAGVPARLIKARSRALLELERRHLPGAGPGRDG